MTTRNCKLRPKTSIVSFPVVGRCRNRSGSVFFKLGVAKNPTFAVGIVILPACHGSRDIRISGFNGRNASISGCRTLSQSLRGTLFELTVIRNTWLAVVISTLLVVVPVVLFPVLAVMSLFPVVIDVTVTCWHFLQTHPGRRFSLGISHIVADISTSGFDGRTVTSGCRSITHLLVGTFFEFGRRGQKLFFAAEL